MRENILHIFRAYLICQNRGSMAPLTPLTPCSDSPDDAKFVLGQEMKSALHKRFFKAFLAHFLTCFLPTTHEFLYSGVQKLCFIKDLKVCSKFYYK